MLVHEAIARTLEHEGVEAVFAVMGDANMRWLADLSASGKVRTYYARSEGAAVAMADGWSRATGKVGVCSVTVGPGLTVAATSLLTAARHRTPLVLIAGDVPGRTRWHIQYIDQPRVLAALGITSCDLTKGSSGRLEVTSALALAAETQAPVVLNTPTDLQDDACDPAELERTIPATSSPGPPEPDQQVIRQIAHQLREARRPVIIAGRGARDSNARAALIELGERGGALLATTMLAKGYFRGEPFDLGMAGFFATPTARSLIEDADLVLAFGATLNRYTSEAGSVFPRARVIMVDRADRGLDDGAVKPSTYLRSDARAAAESLSRELSTKQTGYRTPDVAARLAEAAHGDEPERAYELDGKLDPRGVMRVIDERLTDRDLTVVGMGHFWWFAIHYLKSRSDDSFVFTHDFGAIGQGIATGIGAAIGRPDRRVNVIEGDGSAMMAVQELDTAARYEVPVRLFVMNDEGLGAEYHHLRSLGLEPKDSIMRSPDLALVARGLGAEGHRIDDLAELAAALEDESEPAGPQLFDVRISREVVSEPNRRLWYPEGGERANAH